MPRLSRKLRISLRGALVATAALAVWIGWNAELARRQSRVVDWARSHNGVVAYDLIYDVSVNDRNQVSLNDHEVKSWYKPRWMRELLGENLLGTATSISIQNAELTDISPIAELRSAESLCFATNYLKEVESLRDVDVTNVVILSNNQIDNVDALSGMTALRMLDLRGNYLEDLTPLKTLKELLSLDLSENRIVDLSPLENLKKLKRLGLRKNPIRDVRPLLGLKSLQVLDIGETSVDERQTQLLKSNLPNTRLIVK